VPSEIQQQGWKNIGLGRSQKMTFLQQVRKLDAQLTKK